MLPEVIKNLLIINGLFFLASLALGQFGFDLIKTLGLYLPGAEQFRLLPVGDAYVHALEYLLCAHLLQYVRSVDVWNRPRESLGWATLSDLLSDHRPGSGAFASG